MSYTPDSIYSIDEYGKISVIPPIENNYELTGKKAVEISKSGAFTVMAPADKNPFEGVPILFLAEMDTGEILGVYTSREKLLRSLQIAGFIEGDSLDYVVVRAVPLNIETEGSMWTICSRDVVRK